MTYSKDETIRRDNTMAVKRKAEHKARNIDMVPSVSWSHVLKRIEDMCDEMQTDGWTLLTMAWPHSKRAVLVFTRPGE